MLKPAQNVPSLDVPLVSGERFRLAEQHPETFLMVVVYRGLHCPICKTYLRDLDRRLDDFQKRGVSVLALSTDDQDRAQKTAAEWGLERLPLGYGLTIEEARRWGLFISTAIKETEPAEFAEPGIFLVRPDATLYAASIQSMPFARPSFQEILAAVEFVTQKNYPPRGTA